MPVATKPRKSKRTTVESLTPRHGVSFARSKATKAMSPLTPKRMLPRGSKQKAGETCPSAGDTPKLRAVSPALIEQIRERCARRNAAMQAVIRINHQTKALVRRFLGWQTGLSEEDRANIKTLAGEIIKAIQQSKVVKLPKAQQEVALMVAEFVTHAKMAAKPFEDIQTKEEKALEKLAAELPAAEYIQSIKGVGLLKLAQIVGETGDLNKYANPGKLWKRMGLAPYKGKSPSTWKMTKNSGLTAEDWIAMGYVQTRRALMFVIGDCMIKAKADTKYKKLYYNRKAYEIQREPEIRPVIAHRRAHRIMVKNLLKHVWQAWRGTKPHDEYVK